MLISKQVIGVEMLISIKKYAFLIGSLTKYGKLPGYQEEAFVSIHAHFNFLIVENLKLYLSHLNWYLQFKIYLWVYTFNFIVKTEQN